MKEETELTGKKVSENVWLCPDGVYRWTYEFDMLRNPTILITVWKVLGIPIVLVMVINLIVQLTEGIRSLEDLAGMGKLFLILAGIFFVLGILGYIVTAAMYGWKYQVLFEMTEDHVSHIQMPKQFEQAQALGWLTSFAGIKTGNRGLAGQGLNIAARNAMTTELENVMTLKLRPRRHTIHVNKRLDRNQVYAGKGDFDFVAEFLKAHCPKAKVK